MSISFLSNASITSCRVSGASGFFQDSTVKSRVGLIYFSASSPIRYFNIFTLYSFCLFA